MESGNLPDASETIGRCTLTSVGQPIKSIAHGGDSDSDLHVADHSLEAKEEMFPVVTSEEETSTRTDYNSMVTNCELNIRSGGLGKTSRTKKNEKCLSFGTQSKRTTVKRVLAAVDEGMHACVCV